MWSTPVANVVSLLLLVQLIGCIVDQYVQSRAIPSERSS